ncbi:MAG: Mut7-C RNAse domain-containing protein [Alphaproteobacteria bacterium]
MALTSDQRRLAATSRSAFFCDHMLIRLGRWLRAAGHDTAIAEAGVSDRQLIARAVGEGRLLVSRDRRLLEFRQARATVIVLRANSMAACAEELTTRLGIDWLHRPFTRCLVCNMPLVEASLELAAQVPESSRASLETVFQCVPCDKLYWEGGHVQRMRRKLARWQAREFD